MKTKRCTKCGKRRRLAMFSPNAGHKDGLQSNCKDCGRQMTYRRRSRAPEVNRSYMRARTRALQQLIQRYPDDFALLLAQQLYEVRVTK